MIVGFYNKASGRYHSLDDLEGMERAFEPSLLRAMVEEERGEPRHQGTSLTVTAGLGCPRKLMLERFTPTRPDPQKRLAPYLGGVLHDRMAELLAGEPGWVTEHGGNKARCEFTGTLFGYEMSCRVDAYRVEDGVVERIRDYKFSFVGYPWGDGVAKPEHAAQLNMCRLLMEQNGVKMSPQVVLEAVTVKGGQWMPTFAQVMSEEACGQVKVGGSDWTVRQFMDAVARGFKEVDEGVEGAEVAKDMPLYGLTMYRNKKGGNACSDYCAIVRECGLLEGRL